MPEGIGEAGGAVDGAQERIGGAGGGPGRVGEGRRAPVGIVRCRAVCYDRFVIFLIVFLSERAIFQVFVLSYTVHFLSFCHHY